ncbi:hypothetical protein WA026_003514 [Henosepilachna vigintioctopunctata]|uniref:Uncharacterized protein n=1 Tax=Henosepilachna vigintioctopunctata TaxID=420089 RepID=A0AAW1TN78_9CUCU
MHKNIISIAVAILLVVFAVINASPLTPLRLSGHGNRNRRHAGSSKRIFDKIFEDIRGEAPPEQYDLSGSDGDLAFLSIIHDSSK